MLGVRGVRTHPVKALERVLGRDLRVLGDQRLVGNVMVMPELMLEALRIAEAQTLDPSLAAVSRSDSMPSASQPLGPEVERGR